MPGPACRLTLLAWRGVAWRGVASARRQVVDADLRRHDALSVPPVGQSFGRLLLFCDWPASISPSCWWHGMSSPAQAEGADTRVRDVTVSEDELTAALMDGRTITVVRSQGDQKSVIDPKGHHIIPGSERTDRPAPACVVASQGQLPQTLLLAARKSWVAGPSPAMTRVGQAFRDLVLDGYAASHRTARDIKVDGQLPADTKLCSSKYLKNLIEQGHRGVKLRIDPTLGFKQFRTTAITITGVEPLRRIHKGQFNLDRLFLKDRSAPAVWSAVRAAP